MKICLMVTNFSRIVTIMVLSQLRKVVSIPDKMMRLSKNRM